MAISSKELAALLNISPATVSMVLNGKPGISEATRQKVLDAAKQHGLDISKKQSQEPNLGSLHFVIYKKHGNVVSDTPFFAQLTEGIEASCRLHGYALQISYYYENQNPQMQLEELRNSTAAGFLLLGTEMTKEDLPPFTSLHKPLVIVDSYYEGIPYDTVLINNVQGAYTATCYLAERGHRDIGYLRSSMEINNFKERADGYYKALRRYDIHTNHPYVFRLTPTMDGAYKDMSELLDRSPELPTAFYADNDIIAAAAIRALKEHGLKIPEDISVIGFDNMPIGEYIEPQLTTMHVPKQQLGMHAVNVVLSHILNPDYAPIKIELSTNLIKRGSVK